MKIEIVQKLYSFEGPSVCSSYLAKVNGNYKVFSITDNEVGVSTHFCGELPRIERITKTAKDLFYSELEKSGLK